MNITRRVWFIVAIALLWHGPTLFGDDLQEIKFQLFEGAAALSRTGGATWLELGPAAVVIKPQNMLRTSENSRGEVRFPDGSVFRIKADTRIMLTENGVQVQLGELWLKLTKRRSPFQLMTPTAACSVLGTEFDVHVDRFGRTRVRVFDGLVAVKAHEDPKKRQLVLQRGMLTRIENRATTPEKFQRFDAAGESARLDTAWRALPQYNMAPGFSIQEKNLPPIRPPSPETWHSVAATSTPTTLPPEKTVRSEMLNVDGQQETQSGIRDKLAFFEQMRAHTLKAKRPDEERDKYEVAPLMASRSEKLPQNDGAWFGQGKMSSPIASDSKALHEEYMRMRERLLQVQQDIQKTTSEFEATRRELQALSSNDPNAEVLKMRIEQLSERISLLRERRNELVRQLEILRNRLG